MKLSLNWLSEMLTWREKNLRALAERITLAIAEVEQVEDQGALLEHCCVGKVLKVQKHPNADRLSLVDVETDRGRKGVVCGGTNLREGMLVAFAHIGATIRWHGQELMTLQPVKIRGEASEGMICAATELGLEDRFPAKDEHDIIDLSPRATGNEPTSNLQAGTPLRTALGTDTVFSVPNTAITHRPDLFSHIGFARECRAAGLGAWKQKNEPPRTLPKFPLTPLPFEVELGGRSLVPRYLACTLECPSPGETPPWMRQRLEALGVRTVSLPVDITNYVMLEEGSPLHAFDASKMRGKKIVFREAERGEVVTTLDQVQRELPEGAIVLSDTEGIFDLCGLMGDLRTAATENTRTFFLHAPVYDPVRIRRAIQATGLRTDAATIFEKGVPPISATRGFARALNLLLELCHDARITSQMIQWGTDGTAKPITLSIDRLQNTLGTAIAPKTASLILQGLGCTVRRNKSSNRSKLTAQNSKLVVIPPLHRLRDLTTDVDLVEEVARLSGYDRIPQTLPQALLSLPAHDQRLHRLRDGLREEGFTEIVPLSLVSSALLRNCSMDPTEAIKLQHPLAEETALLQPSTLPSLLKHAQQNILNAAATLRTFHCGHVFGKKIAEHAECGVLIGGMSDTTLPTDPFLRLKLSLIAAFDRVGYALTIAPLLHPPPFAHPGRCASLAIEGDGIGTIFEVHPTIRSRFDLRHRSAAALFDLDAVLKHTPHERLANTLPRFPAVTYDVTLTRTHDHPFGALLKRLHGSHPLLESVSVHDLYSGPSLKNGAYNLTLRCTYRSPERTLTEEEAKQAHEQVLALAVKDLG